MGIKDLRVEPSLAVQDVHGQDRAQGSGPTRLLDQGQERPGLPVEGMHHQAVFPLKAELPPGQGFQDQVGAITEFQAELGRLLAGRLRRQVLNVLLQVLVFEEKIGDAPPVGGLAELQRRSVAADGGIKRQGFCEGKVRVVAAEVRADHRHRDLAPHQLGHDVMEQVPHPGDLEKGRQLQGDNHNAGLIHHNRLSPGLRFSPGCAPPVSPCRPHTRFLRP